MQLSEQEIKAIAEHFNINEAALAEYVHKSKKVKEGPWPARLSWWSNGPKWLKDLNKKYQFLVPILDALKDHKAVSIEKNASVGVEQFEVNGEKADYVLLDLSKSRKIITKQIGCSEKTLSNYLRGLVKCGTLKYFHCGKKGRYYSLGYWAKYPIV